MPIVAAIAKVLFMGVLTKPGDNLIDESGSRIVHLDDDAKNFLGLSVYVSETRRLYDVCRTRISSVWRWVPVLSKIARS